MIKMRLKSPSSRSAHDRITPGVEQRQALNRWFLTPAFYKCFRPDCTRSGHCLSWGDSCRLYPGEPNTDGPAIPRSRRGPDPTTHLLWVTAGSKEQNANPCSPYLPSDRKMTLPQSASKEIPTQRLSEASKRELQFSPAPGWSTPGGILRGKPREASRAA